MKLNKNWKINSRISKCQMRAITPSFLSASSLGILSAMDMNNALKRKILLSGERFIA